MPGDARSPEEFEKDSYEESVPSADDELRTGAEEPVDPIDLVEAKGWDVTPEAIERAREILAREGSRAIDEATQ